MPFLASNINKEKYSCIWVPEIWNWYLSNKVAFSLILLSSFYFQICYIIINFCAKFHQNLILFDLLFFNWDSLHTRMGYSRKKTNRGVEDTGFSGVLNRTWKWIFWGLIKNNVGFQGVIKKKSCEISWGLGFRP